MIHHTQQSPVTLLKIGLFCITIPLIIAILWGLLAAVFSHFSLFNPTTTLVRDETMSNEYWQHYLTQRDAARLPTAVLMNGFGIIALLGSVSIITGLVLIMYGAAKRK